MKFSIVITTFNRLELLKRAVESALAQTLPCEVIIADNASTDGTQTYAESLGDRVIYKRNPTNLNHAGAVNAGVAAATGNWIKLLDDDDYLAPHCIEAMAAAIARHSEAVICSCQAAQVDSAGQELSRTAAAGPGKVFYIPQDAIHYGMFLEMVPFGTPAQVAVRRDAFLKSGGWDLAMTSCDDIDSWIRVAQFGDAVFINDCLAYRTVWEGGYDHKIELQRRLDTNLLIKSRIYQQVHAPYTEKLPSMGAIDRYLHLHWGFVALKQGKIATALMIGLPGLISLQAWQLLRKARQLRTQAMDSAEVPKIILVG